MLPPLESGCGWRRLRGEADLSLPSAMLNPNVAGFLAAAAVTTFTGSGFLKFSGLIGVKPGIFNHVKLN